MKSRSVTRVSTALGLVLLVSIMCGCASNETAQQRKEREDKTGTKLRRRPTARSRKSRRPDASSVEQQMKPQDKRVLSRKVYDRVGFRAGTMS